MGQKKCKEQAFRNKKRYLIDLTKLKAHIDKMDFSIFQKDTTHKQTNNEHQNNHPLLLQGFGGGFQKKTTNPTPDTRYISNYGAY